MGVLVEQPIPTLFGGVSTQPAPVRRANQVATGDNAKFSIFTGGFEKRPGSQLINELTFLDATAQYAVHKIDRDASNQYFLLVADGEIKAVNAITGAQVTVTVGDTTRYFLINNYSQGTGTGIVTLNQSGNQVQQLAIDSSETTFAWSWEMDDATTGRFKVEGSPNGITWYDLQTGIGGAASGTFNTTIGAVAAGDHNYIRVSTTIGMANATDGITLKATFKDLTYLLGSTPDTLRFVSVADVTYVANTNIAMRLAEEDSGTVAATVQSFSELAAPSGSGNINRVSGTDTSGFGTYYVQDDATTSTWLEVVDPNGANNIDGSSMPHKITFDGTTFTYQAEAWTAKESGDDEVNPAPEILGGSVADNPYDDVGPQDGLKPQDLNFYRNRLVILADERAFCSRVGRPNNVWAEKAVEVLDTDPVERAATTNDVNILKFCAVFRKILFATSRRAQFELTSNNAFTPESATFDQATSYAASPVCPPVTMGDVLYFASKGLRHGVVYEYFFDESTLSNTAADISAHVEGYIPNDILFMDTDSTESTLFLVTTADQNVVYVYTTYFDVTKKEQSSWGKYTFGTSESDAFIHGFGVFSGYLVLVIERAMPDGSTSIFLEQVPIDREEQDTTVGFTPFLDQREVLSAGAYDSTYNYTYWTTSYQHQDDVTLVMGPAASEPGREIEPVYPDKYTLTLASVTANQTLILAGETYTANATTTDPSLGTFSISGTNTQDATELAQCINDATDGNATVDATDNLDGTLTITLKDRINGSIATPTGTAISGGTITATEDNNELATTGDVSTGVPWAGVPYTMSVQLSEFFFRGGDPEAKAVITGRLQMKDITFKLETTGYLKATVGLAARDNLEFTFEGKELGSEETVIGAASIAASTTFRVPLWTSSEHLTLTLSSDKPTPCVVSSASWRGFFNEISRQE